MSSVTSCREIRRWLGVYVLDAVHTADGARQRVLWPPAWTAGKLVGPAELLRCCAGSARPRRSA
jgi:hypothetical protein